MRYGCAKRAAAYGFTGSTYAAVINFAAASNPQICADNKEMFSHTLADDQSSHIKEYSYNPDTMVFTVTFKNGAIYQHAQVPREAYINMQLDHSKGAFYHAIIKKYPAVKKAAASK